MGYNSSNMELSVLIQQVSGIGYLASCSEPLAASADGATRAEALAKLKADLESRITAEDEIVRLTIHAKRALSKEPVWPDDQFTRDWLEGIESVRAAANQAPDPWNVPSESGT